MIYSFVKNMLLINNDLLEEKYLMLFIISENISFFWRGEYIIFEFSIKIYSYQFFCSSFSAHKRKLLGGDESRVCDSSESVLHGANPVFLYWKLPYIYPHRGQNIRTFFARFIINGTKQSGQHLLWIMYKWN